MRFFLIPIFLLFTTSSFADVMRVTILGSGTPRPDIDRFSQSILIEADSLSGNGMIRANGGGVWDNRGGSGGGGRIAIHLYGVG